MFAEIILPHRIRVKILQVNVKRIRLAIRGRAKEQIFPGTHQYWDAAVENIYHFLHSCNWFGSAQITKSSARRDEAGSLSADLGSWVALLVTL